MKKNTQSDVAMFAMSKTKQTFQDKFVSMFANGTYGAKRHETITARRPTDFEIAVHRSGHFFGENSGGIEPLYREPYFMRRIKPSSKEIAVDRIAGENPGIFDEMLRKMKESGDKNSHESLGNQQEEK